MTANPSLVISKQNVKARWGEPYTSKAINAKFLGLPTGVYAGFEPSAVGSILTLSVDASKGLSLLQVKSSLSQAMATLFVESALTLDFTGHVTFPVWVVATAEYKPGQPTTGTIQTSTTPGNGYDSISLCRINGLPISDPGNLVFANAPDRHKNLADADSDFGFMTQGAEEDRQAANNIITEVQDAREDTQGNTLADLSARLDADFDPARIADNQGNHIVGLRSNDETDLLGSVINISHSFSADGRDQEPAIDIPGGGSEDQTGAISEVIASIDSTVNDTDRNVLLVQDVKEGRPYADPSTGLPVFARLKYEEVDDSGTTTLFFTNGTNTVLVSSGDPTSNVEPGDIILGPDGNYYPVAKASTAVQASNITLVNNYGGPTGGVDLRRRRFDAHLFTRTGDVETAYSIVVEAVLDSGSWQPGFNGLGLSSPQTPQDFDTNTGKEGQAVRQSYSGSNRLLYVPDSSDPEANELALGDTIQQDGTSNDIVDAVSTINKPTLRFLTPVFQSIDQERSEQLIEQLKGPTIIIPRASENIDGLVRFADESGSERFTALQASDPRVPTTDEAAALSASASPASGNPLITESAIAALRNVGKSSAWGRWQKSGKVNISAGHDNLTWAIADNDEDAGLGVVATIDANGVITLTRPPAGIIFTYQLHAWGSPNEGSGSPETQLSFHLKNNSTRLVFGFGQHGAGGSGGFTNPHASIMLHTSVDDAGTALLPVEFEVWDDSATEPLDAQTWLLINRTARTA